MVHDSQSFETTALLQNNDKTISLAAVALRVDRFACVLAEHTCKSFKCNRYDSPLLFLAILIKPSHFEDVAALYRKCKGLTKYAAPFGDTLFAFPFVAQGSTRTLRRRMSSSACSTSQWRISSRSRRASCRRSSSRRRCTTGSRSSRRTSSHECTRVHTCALCALMYHALVDKTKSKKSTLQVRQCAEGAVGGPTGDEADVG